MRILLCNDDGYRALGINTLAKVLIAGGHDVTVVAPNEERSGQSHAVSFFRPFLVQQVSEKVFRVDGTPADCAIVGIELMKDNPPDIVISGINHGLNVGWDVNYSGTVGAATEATMLGFKAIATSVDLYKRTEHQSAFEHCANFVLRLLENLQELEWPRFEVLNLNHPGEEPAGVTTAECGGYNLYKPAVEIMPSSNMPVKSVSTFMIGGSHRLEATAENQDVTLIQKKFVTLSFVRSRQSSTANNSKIETMLSKLK